MDNLSTLEKNIVNKLDAIDWAGVAIGDLNLGEPAKSEIGKAFIKKRHDLRTSHLKKLLNAIDAAQNIDELNAVMIDLRDEYAIHMKDYTDQINSAYEAQEAALTA